ncbi:GDSL-type esterase/lipase family protein [Streptomyces varsoviensis]|uniref:GDSL-type esterase/lipase family protein n=1 Tax=Streptomyces varsoviensis TaxID=67373 RepID=UPI0004C8D28A|nr:GDSL-type esterase/lipase family protein [Streptomyces varsoviensis]
MNAPARRERHAPVRALAALVALVLAAALAHGLPATAAEKPKAESADARSPHWVGGWGTAMTPPGSSGYSATGFADRTLRMVERLSAGGSAVRLRLSNAYGTSPLDLGAVTVARRAKGAAVEPGSGRVVRFGGQRATTVPAGAEAVSDPVPLATRADTDLVVSVHLPTATGPTTWHPWAKQTNYLSGAGAGDHTGDVSGSAFGEQTTSWFFLDGVDVLAPRAKGTVVAFGDSITEGGVTANDSNRRWTDELGRRLAARPGGQRLSVVNKGIGGNRVLTDAGTQGQGNRNLGNSAESRFGRDALAQTRVSDIIVLEGTNDLGSDAGVHPGTPLTAAQLIAGLDRLARRAHAAGARVHGGTITPNGKLTARGERMREDVNRWIRNGGAFDTVVDFDAALRDPADPHRMLPAYDGGDTVHPNDAGLRVMARTVELSALGRG